MGLLSFLTKDKRANHDFNEKDRELSAQRRRDIQELNTLRQSHAIAEEKERHETKMFELKIEKEEKRMEYEDLFDDDDTPDVANNSMSEEGAMMMQLLKTITPTLQRPTATVNSTPQTSTVAVASFTDEKLKEMWGLVPAPHKALVPKCTDDQIKEYITKQMIPNADEETLNRAVKIARNTY